MTASFSGSAAVSASMNVPQTQNTAPVLEFRCLFTQDLRRKQKRWSDGRVKFHTFNKRVMVYDERSNFVGDTHWREDSDFAEGEELVLERSGTLVEVGEFVAKRYQDLTELVDKRVKEREERFAAKAATLAPSIRNPDTPAPNILRDKTLNSLVTPTGHYGRALIPGISPFENRHGVVAQEKDEQERPSKRRKPNEVTSSKSGYAQNLMGATLSLAYSRPPSTGPIRYEPVRVTPSIPARAATIDLTLEGSDDSEKDNSTTRREAIDLAKPSKVQKKSRRSHPPKSGYASNLTGAALTLSRPNSSRPNRPNTFSAPRSVAISKSGAHESSSDVETEFSGIVSPKILSANEVPKASERHEPRRSRPPSLSDSSSPPKRAKRAPLTEKRTSRPQCSTLKSSATENTPEQPMSALRIKGRSAPKMMMLMNRPPSRAMVSHESSLSGRRKLTPLQKNSSTSNDIVLSQATMDLDAFHQKQEEILQARLRGERRTAIIETEHVPSSPEETGIDHRTINHLSSRRTRPVEKTVAILSDLEPNSDIAAEKNPSREESQPAHEERREERIMLPLFSQTSSPHNDPERSEFHLNAQDASSHVPAGSVVETSGNNGSQLSTSIHEDYAFPLDCPREQEAPDLLYAQTRTTMPGPNTSNRKSRKANPLLDYVAREIQSASKHISTVVKSPASQQHEMEDIPPRLPEPEPERIPKTIQSDPRVQETDPGAINPKTSPEPNQPGNNVVEEGEVVGDTTPVIAHSIPDNVLVPPVVQSMPSPRRVLVNPATRGKSVQALAANTVDILNNPAIISAPSPPRLSSRTETINRPYDVTRGPDRRVASREASDGGPWSREAFDLFDKKTWERIMTLRAASTATATG